MARFSDVDVFLAVARSSSMRQAASGLGLTRSTVSRGVRRLEAHLGVDLLVRGPQSIRLTEAGRAYLDHAQRAAAALAEAERAVARVDEEVRGPLVVTAPRALAQVGLARLCGSFVAAHPRVELELRLSDARARFEREEVDVAVRASPRLADSELRVRRLCSSPLLALAPPDMVLDGRGPLPLVGFALPGGQRLEPPPAPVPTVTRLVVNDYLAMLEAAEAGAVAVAPELIAGPALARGRLVPVLPEWALPLAHYWALHPRSEAAPHKVELFLDHLGTGFAALAGARRG